MRGSAFRHRSRLSATSLESNATQGSRRNIKQDSSQLSGELHARGTSRGARCKFHFAQLKDTYRHERERDRHYPIFSSLETVCRPILAGQIRRCLVLSFKIRFFGKERGRNFRKIRPSSHSNLSFHHQTRFEPKLKRKRKRYNFVNKRTMLEIRLWRGLGSCGLFPSIQRNVEQTACSVIATLLNHTAS